MPAASKVSRPALVRISELTATGTLVVLAYALLHGETWTSGRALHAVAEALATSWALVVGSIALVRHYSRKSAKFLFVGTAFLGAAVFDGYHVLSFTFVSLPTDPELSVAPWSWLASRLFLSSFLAIGWLAVRNEERDGIRWSDRRVYTAGSALLLACVALFTLVPLPTAYIEGLFFGRPAELVPGLVFLVALVGYLNQGGWREDAFEFALILSLLVALVSQVSMGVAQQSYDAMFDLAHVLKLGSYAVVLAGLMVNMFRLFQRAEESAEEIQAVNDALRAEVSERVRVEEELRTLGSSLEVQVQERTRELECSRREALGALELAQEARRKAEAAGVQFRQLLESAPDAMVIVNSGGAIEFVNSASERLFGYESGELLGLSVEVLVPLASRAQHGCQRADYVHDPVPRWKGRELNGRRKDGSHVPVEICLSPIETEGGTLVSAGIHDLTERKAAEAEIAAYTRELERSNEELGQFAYVASHDLQEPLRMVSSFTQLLAKRYGGKLGPDADEFIAHAVDGARRMQALIQDLLAYSRVGRHAIELRPVVCDAVAKLALENLRLAVEESGTRVSIEGLPTVSGDKTQLLQLFQNLIGNAIKFRSDAPSEVELSARREEDGWTFSVRDNGIGIDPAYRDQVFKIFKRLHRRDQYPGTGIGLAVCKRIVEWHGGRIWVESTPGSGCTFRFTLPNPKEVSA